MPKLSPPNVSKKKKPPQKQVLSTQAETPASNAGESASGLLQDGFLSTVAMGEVIDTLAETYHYHPMGDLTRHDPYRVLVACVLSLRTRDEVTMPASERLFALADTPQAMVTLSPDTIEKAIYPAGFYKTKAQTILAFSEKLLSDFQGKVPDTIDALLTLKGVGRKTANLVMGLGHQLPAICVDTHVHRICNRLGYVQTKTPDDTEWALREKLPARYWQTVNTLMVLHGQQICKPIGPRCDNCPVETRCLKVNVRPRPVKKLKTI